MPIVPRDTYPVALVERPWERRFLKAFRVHGNKRLACRSAGVARETVDIYLESCPSFRMKFVAAKRDAADRLEQVAWNRAVKGEPKPVIYRGHLQGIWRDPETGDVVSETTPGAVFSPLILREKDNHLLEVLLKAAKPKKYSPRPEKGSAGVVVNQVLVGISEEEIMSGKLTG